MVVRGSVSGATRSAMAHSVSPGRTVMRWVAGPSSAPEGEGLWLDEAEQAGAQRDQGQRARPGVRDG